MRFFTASLRTLSVTLIASAIIATAYLAASFPAEAQANPSCSITATPSSVERGGTANLSFSFSSMPPGGTITGARLSNFPNSFTVPVQVIDGTTFRGRIISPTNPITEYTLTVDFSFAQGIASLNCSTSVTVVDPVPAPVPEEPVAEECEPYDCAVTPPPPAGECDPSLPEEYGGCPPASGPTPPATDTFPHNTYLITDDTGKQQAGTVCALNCSPGSTEPFCTYATCNDTQPGFACGHPGASYNAPYSNMFCSDGGGTNCACWNPTYSDPSKPRDQFNVGGYGTGTGGGGGTGGSGGSPSTVTPLSSPTIAQEGFPWPVRPGGEAGFDSFSGFVLLLLDLIGYLVFFLMAVAFVIFLWGIVQAWVLGAGNEQSIEKGKQFALAGIIGFVVVFSLWGIIALLQATFFGVS